MSNIKKYSDHWTYIEKIGAGGQGETYKVHEINSKENIVAVKKPKQQKDAERRGRMRRETIALETLSHPNIAKLIDSNVEYWQDLDYQLFIATDYITGSTLEEFSLLTSSLNDKIRLVKNICEIVNYCHNRGVVHRNIKPENIILKDNSVDNPILIDFGLSFNFLDTDNDNLTPDWQHIGNRFLILPEQKVGEVSKRDFRSDVTFLVGIFFYVLTNKQIPVNLLNQHHQKPHQRDEAKAIIDTFPYHQRVIVNNIFDTGFEYMINKRWQTVQSLIVQLKLLEEAESIELESADDLIEEINKQLQNIDYSYEKKIKTIFDKIGIEAANVFSEIKQNLGNVYWTYSSRVPISGLQIINHELNKSDSYSVNSILKPAISAVLAYKAFITGNEIVVQIIEEKKSSEILRQAIDNEIDWNNFTYSLRTQWLSYIHKKVST